MLRNFAVSEDSMLQFHIHVQLQPLQSKEFKLISTAAPCYLFHSVWGLQPSWSSSKLCCTWCDHKRAMYDHPVVFTASLQLENHVGPILVQEHRKAVQHVVYIKPKDVPFRYSRPTCGSWRHCNGRCAPVAPKIILIYHRGSYSRPKWPQYQGLIDT
jgi:hypothetical protein